jgi:hypothetical protein
MSDLVRGLNALDKARPDYTFAWKMYDGTAREVAANDNVRPIIEKTAAYYRANFARKPVRARLNRLEVSALQVAGDEPAEGQERGALTQRLYEQVEKPNEFDIEIPRFLEFVAAYGDAYLLRWPKTLAGSGERPTAAEVDVFVHSPMNMRAIYDDENPRKILFVINSWSTGDGDDQRIRVNLYYDDRVERLVSLEPVERGSRWADDMFVPYTAELDDEDPLGTGPVIAYVAVGVDGMPIEHGRTARPYGRPVHYDAYGPQNAITKIIATHLSGIDWNGWPWRYALSRANTTGADLNDWDDDDRQAPGKPGVSVKPSGKLNAKPGTMNKLHDTDSVGQLEGAGPEVFLEPLTAYIRVLGETTDTPMNVIDPTGQVESGQSRTARIDDLLSDVKSLKTQLAGPIASTCEGALAMLGAAGETVTVTWAPSARVTDAEGWAAVKAQQDAGVPERVTLIEAGYLPEQVDEWEADLGGKLNALERIAAVGLMLGQATQVMGLPAETATQLFAAFIAEVVTGEDVELPEIVIPDPGTEPEPDGGAGNDGTGA